MESSHIKNSEAMSRMKHYHYSYPENYFNSELYKHILPPNPLLLQNQFQTPTPTVRLLDLQSETKESPKSISSEEEEELEFFLESKYLLDRRDTLLFSRDETVTSKTDDSLHFDSRFESGNLQSAYQTQDSEYTLFLQNDVNTKGNTQWFYFQVSNTKKDSSVKFNIVNLGKPSSLFNSGMRVLMHSKKEKENSGLGWFRTGSNIHYFRNHLKKPPNKRYYTLSFEISFLHEDDIVYLAYSHPYTHSELTSYLKNKKVKREVLCHTVGGRLCEYLTITGDSDHKKKKGVVLTARVHPGETVGSWMMKGALDFLLSEDPEAVALKKLYVFKVVPMLNPDGVALGNYRCGLSGCDLNRRWKTPSEKLHPTIFHTKRMIKEFSKERKIELVCDMHGHSRRKNIFMYGCHLAKNPELTRIFPYLLSKRSPFFSYQYCAFNMQRSKESTMRISMFKELQVPAVYTLEASFCGMNTGPYEGMDFEPVHLMQMGKELCQALLTPSEEKTKLIKELVLEPSFLQENSESGSDSDPSEDNSEITELASIIKVSILKPKKVEPNRSLSAHKYAKIFKKCPICGVREEKHKCLHNASGFSQSTKKTRLLREFIPYINAKGKQVKDSFTQTDVLPKAVFKEDIKFYQNNFKTSIHNKSPMPIVPRKKKPTDFCAIRKSWGHNTAGLPILSNKNAAKLKLNYILGRNK